MRLLLVEDDDIIAQGVAIALTQAGFRVERASDGDTAWIMGNEAWGLPQADRDLADRVVGVPMWGQAESLNLSTAAAVCLYASASAQHTASD